MAILYVLLAIFVFGFLIAVHELGHFLVARAVGVGVYEFSIGMGPKIISKKSAKSGIEYSLRALPFGGYVSMEGEDEESDSPTAFGQKKVWQRVLVTVAGPLMNLIIGLILIAVMVISTPRLASTTIGGFSEGATSPSFGLQVGDTVTHVNGVRVHTGNELVYEVMNEGYEPIDLTVRRGEETLVLGDVIFPGQSAEGVSFGSPDFLVRAEEKNLGNILKHTWFRTGSTIKMILDQLRDLIGGRYSFGAVSGPVGVTEGLVEAAKVGPMNFIYLVAVITVNLGVFNLLPIPALDGGRLLFLAIEGISRRKINKNVEGYIHLAGFVILFAIMIIVFCKDIAGLFVR